MPRAHWPHSSAQCSRLRRMHSRMAQLRTTRPSSRLAIQTMLPRGLQPRGRPRQLRCGSLCSSLRSRLSASGTAARRSRGALRSPVSSPVRSLRWRGGLPMPRCEHSSRRVRTCRTKWRQKSCFAALKRPPAGLQARGRWHRDRLYCNAQVQALRHDPYAAWRGRNCL
jgi:hypothetical protein